jgi:hypothetical protein
LNLPLPENWPEFKISNVKMEGDDLMLIKNQLGPGQLVRSYYKPAPKKDKVVSITLEYDVEVKTVNTLTDGLDKISFADYTHDDEYRYNMGIGRKEKILEAPIVVKTVESLKQSGDGPYLYAQRVYNWVGENIEYGKCSGGNGVIACLTEKKGECVSIASTFVALCRAGGVPARFVAGYWVGGHNAYHCWAEFFLPGVGWMPAEHAHKAKGFGYLSNNHIPVAKAGSMKLSDAPKGSKECGWVQVGYWSFWYAGGVEFQGKQIRCEFNMESYPLANMEKANHLDSENLLVKSKELKSKKKYESAVDHYRWTLLHDSAPDKIKVQAMFDLADCYFETNRPVHACFTLDQILEKFSDQKRICRGVEIKRKKFRRKKVWLSDLGMRKTKQQHGRPVNNKSIDKNDLSIGGVKFDKGIGSHANSQIWIETNGSLEFFSAYVGVDDEVPKGAGSVNFMVIGDKKILWESGTMRSGDQAKKIDLKTSSVKNLVLVADDAGDGNNSDHADWADARFTINGKFPTITKPKTDNILAEIN